MGRRTKKVPFKSFDPEEEDEEEDEWSAEDGEWDLDTDHKPTNQTQDVKIKQQNSSKTRKD